MYLWNSAGFYKKALSILLSRNLQGEKDCLLICMVQSF
jgi:hypothetical protein